MLKILIKILFLTLFQYVIIFNTYADYFDQPYWPDELYKDGEPDYSDGDLEDKLGDSGYYYDLFPEERDEDIDDYDSKSNDPKTDFNNPITIYENHVSGYYNDPNSLRNYNNNYKIIIKDTNGNIIGNPYIGKINTIETYDNNMLDGGFKEVNGNTYYINSDGSFKTQWLQINDDWYYFDKETYIMLQDVAKNINDRLYYFESDGKMAKNTNKIINGIYYTIGADGVCKY